MRYPLLFLVLIGMVLCMPTQRHDANKTRAKVIAKVITPQEQAGLLQIADDAATRLRALPPLHQVLLMTMVAIGAVIGATLLAYCINSLAAILGLGISLAMAALLALACLPGLLVGRRASWERLLNHLGRHAEFGPFVSRLRTRVWQKRRRRAAEENHELYQYIA